MKGSGSALPVAAAVGRIILQCCRKYITSCRSRRRDSEYNAFGVLSLPGLAHMKVLIEAGAGNDSREKDGKTPLIIASARGQVEAVKLLQSTGGDLLARDKNGQGALDVARTKGETDATSLLEEAKKKSSP